MTSTVVASIAVGAITYLGRVARNKPMSIDIVVGVGGLAVMLALIEMVNKELATKFAALAVIAVMVAHAKPIAEATGLGIVK